MLHILSELEVLGIPTDMQAYLGYNKTVFVKGILKSHSHQPKVLDQEVTVITHCGVGWLTPAIGMYKYGRGPEYMLHVCVCM